MNNRKIVIAVIGHNSLSVLGFDANAIMKRFYLQRSCYVVAMSNTLKPETRSFCNIQVSSVQYAAVHTRRLPHWNDNYKATQTIGHYSIGIQVF